MKKYLLTVLSAIILSFNGIAQCGTAVTPTVYITSINSPICPGAPAIFNINYYGGGTNPTFAFSSNGMALFPWQYNFSGASGGWANLIITDQNFNQGQILTIEMTSNDPCATITKATNTFQIIVAPPLYINNLTEQSKTICTPGSYTLSTSPFNNSFSNFNWYNYTTNQLISGATNSSYSPTTSGQYYMGYTYTGPLGTATCNSNIFTLTVTNCSPFSSSISGPNPITPGAQNAVYSVSNQTGITYAWSITGGTIVSGLGTNSVTVNWDAATNPSSYSISVVETNAANETKTTTETINSITTRTALSQAQSGIKLFPNPTTESFNIEMPESGVDVSYEVLDLTGLSVASGTFTSTGSDQKINANFGAGMYQIVLKYNNVVTCVRLSKVQ